MSAILRVVKSNEQIIKNDYINHDIQLQPKTGIFFADFINDTILRKSRRMGVSYMRNYKTLIYHLNRFSELYNVNIFINSVNEYFLDDFIVYLEEQQLRLNYIKGLLSLVKSMLSKAGSYGYLIDSSFDEVVVGNDEQNSIYLSMGEIARIYYFKGLTKYQERIKDLFVVGCLTALRYSDYSTLTKEDFQGDFIVKITKKTGKKVIIPIHEYVKEIYSKYDGEISEGLSIQHFNRYLKLICKKIGLDEEIIIQYTCGGKLVSKTKYKYEMVTSHTARRSAATNMYLTGRIKTYEIMSITGHTTEKSFFRYIRTTSEDTASQLKADNYFKK